MIKRACPGLSQFALLMLLADRQFVPPQRRRRVIGETHAIAVRLIKRRSFHDADGPARQHQIACIASHFDERDDLRADGNDQVIIDWLLLRH